MKPSVVDLLAAIQREDMHAKTRFFHSLDVYKKAEADSNGEELDPAKLAQELETMTKRKAARVKRFMRLRAVCSKWGKVPLEDYMNLVMRTLAF